MAGEINLLAKVTMFIGSEQRKECCKIRSICHEYYLGGWFWCDYTLEVLNAFSKIVKCV